MTKNTAILNSTWNCTELDNFGKLEKSELSLLVISVIDQV